MGVGISTFADMRTFLIGMDDEQIMNEFDDIKNRLRKCSESYIDYQTQEYVIPSKLNSLKNNIDSNNKLYSMVSILEEEWYMIKHRMNSLKKQNMFV